jgi:hypothetical protein
MKAKKKASFQAQVCKTQSPETNESQKSFIPIPSLQNPGSHDYRRRVVKSEPALINLFKSNKMLSL